MAGNRPSNAELQRRIAIVQDLLAKKYKRSEIYEYIRNEMGWDVSYHTMYTYVNRAKAEISKSISRNAWQNLAESMMDMRYLYRHAVEAGDLKTALAVRKEMNQVLEIQASNAEMVDVSEERQEIGSELDGMIADITPMRKKKA